MKRFIFLSTIVYILLLLGLALLGGGFIALAIPFVLYLLFGFYNAPEPPQIRIERSLSSDRVAPGADVIVSLRIHNDGGDIEELSVEDMISSNLTVRLGSTRHLFRLPKGDSHTVTYTIAGPRGAYKFESVRIEAHDGLGLIHRTQIIPTVGQLFVFPDVRRLKSVVIRPRKTRVYAGQIPARAGGSGTDFFGVRDYQPGDSPRAINWHASARHTDNLYANEFQQERVADVGIVLDARERANLFREGHSLFEHSITAAAALSDALIAQGNRVGLLVYGGYLNWTLPAYGKFQRERILHSLATAMVGHSSVFEGLEHLSARMFPPESQIILVSSLTNDDLDIVAQFRARGYQVLVVSPDPIKYELELLPSAKHVEVASRIVRLERNLLIRKLERAGVQVIEWDIAKPFDQAVGPVLMRPHPQGFVHWRMS